MSPIGSFNAKAVMLCYQQEAAMRKQAVRPAPDCNAIWSEIDQQFRDLDDRAQPVHSEETQRIVREHVGKYVNSQKSNTNGTKSLYIHDIIDRRFLLRREPDVETQIPDGAVWLFAVGIILVATGIVANWFTDSGTPILLLAIGFGVIAASLQLGKRALPHGSKRG